MVKKHFTINLYSKWFQRSPPGGGSALHKDDFPDSDQHKCCGGCWTGCSPVAWAQLFGYYDRRATAYNSIFSLGIYGDSSTLAPLGMTSEVETLVEDIRSQVQTYCEDGAGATPKSKMHLVAP